MSFLTPYLMYIKIAGVLAILGIVGGTCYHYGSLSSQEKLQADHAAQLAAVVKGFTDKEAAEAAQRKIDNSAQVKHDQDVSDINSLTPIGTPVIVYRSAAQVCSGAVSGDRSQANPNGAGPAKGGSEPVDRGSDIRPAIEELKKRLEIVMADYRNEDSQFPKPSP